MGVSSRLVKFNEPCPKKRFGQHFLRDRGVVERIARWIQPAPDDVFLDIGAGDGALSQSLAPGAFRLLAIELDTDCIPQLENALASYPSASVIQGDILKLDLPQIVSPYLEPRTRLRVAGNLPYNISTVIIEKLLHIDLPIEDMRFMVQMEVAQRITAVPGTKDYGYFSLVCQHRSRVQMGFKVSPACFVPRPKVSSAMVSFHLKPKTWGSACEADFESLGKAAFSYRRKTLENSLSRHPILGRLSSVLLERAGIDGSRRAEELSVEEYEHLAQIYNKLRMTDIK
jgi:16S rRNA (adenine1518-N6/adenine1519-N6)-dimethyltransferase